VKIGISLGTLNPRYWVEATETADRLGLESVWISDHLVLPVEMGGSPHAGQETPPIPADVAVFDPFGYLAFLAARTRSIRLGTQVYNVGLRHPFVTARAVATLDVVSGGRVELGVGASWLKAEWEAVGLDFSTRGRRVDEAIEVCRRLWRDDVVEHHGEFFRFAPVRFEPKPIQVGGPPVHVGGDSPAALRRAARLGAGWIPMNHPLEEIPAAAAELGRLAEAAGRTDRIEITLAGAVRSPDDLDRFSAAGVDRVIVRPWRRSAEAVESLHRFAEDVLAALPQEPT
jgi:probable F420-dependent oxidoreductase